MTKYVVLLTIVSAAGFGVMKKKVSQEENVVYISKNFERSSLEYTAILPVSPVLPQAVRTEYVVSFAGYPISTQSCSCTPSYHLQPLQPKPRLD